jgi:hypothetical protein
LASPGDSTCRLIFVFFAPGLLHLSFFTRTLRLSISFVAVIGFYLPFFIGEARRHSPPNLRPNAVSLKIGGGRDRWHSMRQDL